MGPTDASSDAPTEPTSLGELARLFLWLGTTSFGGPAAHIARMEEEVVRRRRWLTPAAFLDLLGAVNLIPGPNSTELAIHIGHVRAGWRGLLVAGACFIAPAVAMVLACAWAYVRFGALPAVAGLLYGVKPVVLAVVLQALWNLGRTAIKGPLAALVGAAVVALYLLHQDEIALLFGGAAAFAAIEMARRRPAQTTRAFAPGALLVWGAQAIPGALPVTLGRLFVAFLKIGATLYGSGYVLVAFLRSEFVERARWLSGRQLLDAVSVGQFTPGPVFTTATFVGYLVAGPAGAAVATLGIFLPSFVFVGLTARLIPRLRAWAWTGALLDGVNVAALGLMAGVGVELGRSTFARDGRPDLVAVALFAASAALLIRWRVNSTWLLLAGALAGLVARRYGM